MKKELKTILIFQCNKKGLDWEEYSKEIFLPFVPSRGQIIELKDFYTLVVKDVIWFEEGNTVMLKVDVCGAGIGWPEYGEKASDFLKRFIDTGWKLQT